MTAFIGIDASWTGLGLVAIRDGAHLADTLISTKKDEFPNRCARLQLLRDKVASSVASISGVSLVAIEGYSMGSTNGREMAGELGGAIRMLVWSMGLPFIEVPPTTLKAFVTGSGKGDKNRMLLEVYKRWNFDASDDNVCDAFALAKYAEAYMAGEQSAAFRKLVAKTPITHPKSIDRVLQAV